MSTFDDELLKLVLDYENLRPLPMPAMPKFEYFTCVDIGQSVDYTAMETKWTFVRLSRMESRTPYPGIATGIGRHMRTLGDCGMCSLAVDVAVSGAGGKVVEKVGGRCCSPSLDGPATRSPRPI